MSRDAARSLWWTLEPLHDLVYFAPAVRETGIALGLRGFWMTYFAFRAAPLGAVGPEPVTAMFAGFAPAMVAKALPDAWSRVTPDTCLQVRAEVSAAELRSIGLDDGASRSAVKLLAPVVEGADRTGRPLFAANARLSLPDDPVAGLWQVTSTLREHRGDGHVAALVAAQVSGLEAHLLQIGARRFTEEVIRAARGWPDDEWAAAGARLRERGLLAPGTAIELTEAGRALLADIEARTDEAAWTGGLHALGVEGVERVRDLLAPAVGAVLASGMLPVVSPTGLPPHGATS